MSSGWAPMAMAAFAGMFTALQLYSFTGRSRLIRREKNLVGSGRVGEARQAHLFVLVQRFKKRLELRLVGMIRHVARIKELHRQTAPGVFVGLQLHRMKLVVQQTALAAHQVSVEIIGLQAVNYRGALADAAILELEDRYTRGRVLVRIEDFALRFRVVTSHFFDLISHAKQ